MENDLQYKSVPFEVKASAPDGSTGEGIASVFFNVDSYREIVDDGAFDVDLSDFTENGVFAGLNHNWDMPLGKPTKAKVNSVGLEVAWKISETSYGRDMMVLLKDRVIQNLSIGYQTMGRQILETFEEVQSYWKKKKYAPSAQDIARAQGGAVLLTRVKLFEFSPVMVPANDLAFITAVKAARVAVEETLQVGKDTTEVPDLHEVPDEPSDTERLDKIRAIAARKDAEEILRNAGFSRTESAALFSGLKTLLRNAVSDDAGTPDGETAEEPIDETDAEAPVESVETPSVDTVPVPEPEPIEAAPETDGATPDGDGDKSSAGQGSSVNRSAINPHAPYGLDLLREKQEVALLLVRQRDAIFSRLDRDLGRRH